jgi:hypothetical protein
MVRSRNGILGCVRLMLLMIAGCAACAVYPLPSTVDQLQARGYTSSHTFSTTAMGERRENLDYAIWWKEFRGQGRIRHFCFVPGPMFTSVGYNWKITVAVDDRQVWEWQSGAFQGRPPTEKGISCTETPPLPEGRVNWLVSWVRWN